MTEAKAIWDPRNQDEWLKRVARTELPPLIISVAITGGVAGKEINPNIPETPEEQAQSTYDAYNAGASVVHVHARVPENPAHGSVDPEDYRKINRLIREKCPYIIINNTTGGGQEADQSKVIDAIKSGPETASLDMGPLAARFKLKARPECGRPEDVHIDSIAPFGFAQTEHYATVMQELGVKPEMEVWHTGQWWLVQNVIDKGLVKPPYLIQLVMGFQSGAYPTPKEIVHLIDTAPTPANFFVCGVGPWQASVVTAGILLGINVRTGLEDNTHIEKGVLATSNAQLVEKTVRIARELSREIATPQQARQMLGLSETPSSY